MDLPLPNQSPALPTLQSEDPEKKKKIILFVGIGVIAVGAILAGIIFSSLPNGKTSSKSNINNSKTGKNTSSLTTNTSSTDPSQSNEQTTLPTIPIEVVNSNVIPSKQENEYRIRVWQEYDGDTVDTVRLEKKSNGEFKVIGLAVNDSPGDSAFFTKDNSMLIFIGGSVDDVEYQKISFYSVPKENVLYQISLDDIKKALPKIKIQEDAVLSRMAPSPNGEKIAFSYGNTFNIAQIDPNEDIIVMDLSTSKFSLLKTKGLMHSWKNDNTIRYELNPASSNPSIVPPNPDDPEYLTYPDKNIIKEASINDIQN